MKTEHESSAVTTAVMTEKTPETFQIWPENSTTWSRWRKQGGAEGQTPLLAPFEQFVTSLDDYLISTLTCNIYNNLSIKS
jgi:hypothetical protein